MYSSSIYPLIPGLVGRRPLLGLLSDLNVFNVRNFRYMQTTAMKPPNIVIYTGNDVSKYEIMKQQLESIILPNCFTTSSLTSQGLREQPWQSSTKLLVVLGEVAASDALISSYFDKGGDVFSVGSDLLDSSRLPRQSVEGVSYGRLPYKLFSSLAGGRLVSAEDLTNRGDALKFFMEQLFGIPCKDPSQGTSETLPSVEAFLLGESNQLSDFLASIGHNSNKRSIARGPYTLNVCSDGTKVTRKVNSLNMFLEKECSIFRYEEYLSSLTTVSLGRIVLCADVLESTHGLIENGIPYHGWIVIAGQQTKGKGCATFSVQLKVSLSSSLGQHLSVIQHVAALAVVLAAKTLPGCEELALSIKWPNDLYSEKSKLGGILVTSSIIGQEAVVNIGIGINLSNSKPTGCLNDLRGKNNLPGLSREKLIALVLNQLEKLVRCINTGQLNEMMNLYQQHWLHSNASVTISRDGKNVEAVVTGINEYGFLQTRLKDGKIIIVQPDGNSFDMLSGLVAPKH